MDSFWKRFTSKKEAPPNTPRSRGRKETERLIDPKSISSDAVASLQKIMEREERRARRNPGTVMMVESETRVITPPRTSFSDGEEYIRNIFHSPGAQKDKKHNSEPPESDNKTSRS